MTDASPNLQRGDREMKPCPFCKSRRKVRTADVSNGEQDVTRVVCTKCGAEGPNGSGREDAIKLWNAATRQSPEAVTDEMVKALTFAHRTLVDHRIARALREDARMGGAADMVSKVVNKARAALMSYTYHDPDLYEPVYGGSTCPFHQANPGGHHPGCTCSVTMGYRRVSDETYLAVKAKKARTREDKILAEARVIRARRRRGASGIDTRSAIDSEAGVARKGESPTPKGDAQT